MQSQHVLLAVEVRMREHARILEQDRAPVRPAWHGRALGRAHAASLPATVSSTAMRTATPLLTCARITDWGPSAISEAISMPRFIGCGCMTMACGEARRSRAALSP